MQLLLRGGHGNMSVSFGGQMMLPQILRERGVSAAFRAARGYASDDHRLWWNVTHLLAGPALPPGLYKRFLRLRGSGETARHSPFLTADFRHRVQMIRRANHDDMRPDRQATQMIARYFDRAEQTNAVASVLFDIETADPTADPTVIDHILAQPPEFLLSKKDRRPLFEAAFGERIPPAVLYAPPTGMPGEDWNLSINPAELIGASLLYEQNPTVRDVVDLPAIRSALSKWPKSRPTADEEQLFVQELLNALSLASFVFVRFG